MVDFKCREWPLPKDARDYCVTCDGEHHPQRHEWIVSLSIAADAVDLSGYVVEVGPTTIWEQP